MPHRKGRRCRRLGGHRGFKPMGVPGHSLEQVVLGLDEFEALRLCDLEGRQQTEAGELMDVSRGTVQRLLVRARAKVADALLNQKMIVLLDGYEQENPKESV
ncbi:MAG: DUF134 domain-containing protein [Spirochaetales bacterium]|nr:DUF134 domain-containing protein [Spirochaetales bacterium]